jgi:hypothetical protein
VKRALILLLFLAARVPLLFLRQPFFDELYTQWICGRNVLAALRFDSGPPLYYWLMQLMGTMPLFAMRTLSLVFGAVTVVALMGAEKLGESRFAAAALLAVFPPAVLFAVDARAYALCAMFAALGVIALAYERPFLAAAMFVLAGYSHYYGVLFLPLLVQRWRALATAVVLFLPGFWLAFHQPEAARQWMHAGWPDALFARPPILLAVVMAVLFVAACVDRLKPVLTLPWLVPLALALAFGVYVPLRFESVIAVPLLLWLASAKRVVLIPLGVAFAAWTALGIVDHATRPVDDYRAAAQFVAEAKEPVVASGYLYLETIVQRPAIAFPPEQAQHPGWRAVAQSGSGLPAGAFLWVGERDAPELSIIRRTRRVEPLYANSRAMVVKVH